MDLQDFQVAVNASRVLDDPLCSLWVGTIYVGCHRQNDGLWTTRRLGGVRQGGVLTSHLYNIFVADQIRAGGKGIRILTGTYSHRSNSGGRMTWYICLQLHRC